MALLSFLESCWFSWTMFAVSVVSREARDWVSVLNSGLSMYPVEREVVGSAERVGRRGEDMVVAVVEVMCSGTIYM